MNAQATPTATIAATTPSSSTIIAYNSVPDCFVDGHSGSNIADLENLGIEAVTAEGGRSDQRNLVSAISQAFQTSETDVVDLAVNQHLGDAPFIQDGVLSLQDLHTGENVVIELKPGDPQRFKEVKELLAAMGERVDRVIPWQGEGCFEGGDALLPLMQKNGTAILPLGIRKNVPGDTAKYSIRSNYAGAMSLTELIKPLGYRGSLFEFEDGLHATSRLSGNCTNSGRAVVVADPRSLASRGAQQLEAMGFSVRYWPEQHLKYAWYGVNGLYLAGKRVYCGLEQVVEFYEQNDMPADATFAPMNHMMGNQGSATCLVNAPQAPLPEQA